MSMSDEQTPSPDTNNLRDLSDLLTPRERRALDQDLAEIARLRRKALDSARDWPMP